MPVISITWTSPKEMSQAFYTSGCGGFDMAAFGKSA